MNPLLLFSLSLSLSTFSIIRFTSSWRFKGDIICSQSHVKLQWQRVILLCTNFRQTLICIANNTQSNGAHKINIIDEIRVVCTRCEYQFESSVFRFSLYKYIFSARAFVMLLISSSFSIDNQARNCTRYSQSFDFISNGKY